MAFLDCGKLAFLVWAGTSSSLYPLDVKYSDAEMHSNMNPDELSLSRLFFLPFTTFIHLQA